MVCAISRLDDYLDRACDEAMAAVLICFLRFDLYSQGVNVLTAAVELSFGVSHLFSFDHVSPTCMSCYSKTCKWKFFTPQRIGWLLFHRGTSQNINNASTIDVIKIFRALDDKWWESWLVALIITGGSAQTGFLAFIQTSLRACHKTVCVNPQGSLL